MTTKEPENSNLLLKALSSPLLFFSGNFQRGSVDPEGFDGEFAWGLWLECQAVVAVFEALGENRGIFFR